MDTCIALLLALKQTFNASVLLLEVLAMATQDEQDIIMGVLAFVPEKAWLQPLSASHGGDVVRGTVCCMLLGEVVGSVCCHG